MKKFETMESKVKNEKIGVIFSDDNFRLVCREGESIYKTYYKTYEIERIREGEAFKYVVDLYLRQANMMNETGPTYYEPEGIEVKYGFGSTMVSINKFIKVLKDSTKFAEKVSKYLGVPIINK